MTLFQNRCLLCLLLLAAACSQSNKPGPPVTPSTGADTNKPPVQTSGHQPDPAIQIGEDFSKLTAAELDKEDQTHMDMAYFPANYASDMAFSKPVSLKIRVVYSRPHKRGRSVIFGNPSVVPYETLWRLGANESTEVEFATDVEIGGKRIAKGRYTLYAIPHPATWTLIINAGLFTWGDFNYDPKKDVVRTEIRTEIRSSPLEIFHIFFQKTPTGANMIMAWDNIQAVLPVKIL